MKIVILFVSMFLISAPCFAEVYRLHPGPADFEGQRFDIDLKFHCPEGEVTCDDVDYDGINKKTGARLHLKGRVMSNPNSMNFQGYEFDNGKYSYTLTPDYAQSTGSQEIWILNVFYEDKPIATDQGVMH